MRIAIEKNNFAGDYAGHRNIIDNSIGNFRGRWTLGLMDGPSCIQKTPHELPDSWNVFLWACSSVAIHSIPFSAVVFFWSHWLALLGMGMRTASDRDVRVESGIDPQRQWPHFWGVSGVYIVCFI